MLGHETPDQAPPMFVLLRAARYLGVPPWELAEQPAIWQHYALIAESAEVTASDWRMKHSR